MVGGFYLKALRQLTKVFAVGPDFGGGSDVELLPGQPLGPTLEKHGPFDAYVQFYSKPDWFPPDLHALSIPKVWVLYDLHLHLDELSNTAGLFDLVLVTDEPTKKQMLERGHPHVEVLPFAVDRETFHRPHLERERSHDIGFSGSITDHPQLAPRAQLLETLGREFDLRVENRSLTGPAVADFYQECRLVLNHAVQDDINMRIYETLLAGRPLLTPKVTGIEAIVQDGIHASIFRDQEDLQGRIRHLLAHPEEAEAMAQRGQALALEAHTYEARSKRLLEHCGKTWKAPLQHPHHRAFAQFSYHWFRYPGDAIDWLLAREGGTRGPDKLLLNLLKVFRLTLKLWQTLARREYFQVKK